jgi:hypothetical protein
VPLDRLPTAGIFSRLQGRSFRQKRARVIGLPVASGSTVLETAISRMPAGSRPARAAAAAHAVADRPDGCRQFALSSLVSPKLNGVEFFQFFNHFANRQALSLV